MTSDSIGDRSSDSQGQRLLVFALVMTAIAYLATLRFGFVYDDGPQIVFNPTLTSWNTLPSLFLSHSWKFLMPDWAGNYYRPIFMSWLLVNRMLFGVNPVAWHATTVLLHLIATFMSYQAARRILQDGTQAGFVALLFGLHPIHVESVAWVSGLTDPLMSIFVLGALWAWITGEQNPDRRMMWRLLAAVFYAAGCLTKEPAILLPLMIIAHDVLFERQEKDVKGAISATVRVWPLWIVAAAYMIVRMMALKGLVHPTDVPLSQNILTIPTILWGYMRRLVWPGNMSLFYATPPVKSIAQWRFWLPLVALIPGVVLAWRIASRSRIVAFSIVWTLLFLSPAIVGLPAFPIGEWIHDRYLYLPVFGFCLLVVHAISQLRSNRELFGYPAVPAAFVFLLSAAMAFGTTWQEQYWATSPLLFAHSVKVEPNSSLAKSHLAAFLLWKGDVGNARSLYEQSLKIDPDNWKINVAYANMLYNLGEFRLAEERYTHALAIDPSDSNAHINQGLSRIHLENYAGAEESFREAIRRNPKSPHGHYWLGVALEKQGKLEDARREYIEELTQHPNTDTDARQRLESLPKSQPLPTPHKLRNRACHPGGIQFGIGWTHLFQENA